MKNVIKTSVGFLLISFLTISCANEAKNMESLPPSKSNQNSKKIKQFEFSDNYQMVQNRGVPSSCNFDNLQLPNDFFVYAAGGYSGRKLDFQIDQSGHTATQFDVAINSPQKPVVLMLGAYEPTVWNIGWTPKTKIIAVLVSGYHRQAVAGLKNSVPLLISSHENKGPCSYYYVGQKNNNKLNPLSRSLFGRPVDLVFPGNKSGKIVVGESIKPTSKLITSSEISPESFYDKTAPLAGKAGLEAAIKKGIIRRATKADVDAWIEAVIKASPSVDVPPVNGQGIPKPRIPHLHNPFVVLKPFTYPAGLYGGNSATFFILKGVPKPSGKPGHSRVYNFNTLRCEGAGCGQH